MKSAIIGGMLVVCAVIMTEMVHARGPMGGGPGFCDRQGCVNAGNSSAEQWQRFRADSLEQREKMSAKKFELEKETLQTHPDADKIAGLEAEISNLRTSIQDLRNKAGLANCEMNGFDCRNKDNSGNCGRMTNCGRGSGRCRQ